MTQQGLTHADLVVWGLRHPGELAKVPFYRLYTRSFVEAFKVIRRPRRGQYPRCRRATGQEHP